MRSLIRRHPYLAMALLAVAIFMVTTAESCGNTPAEQQRKDSISARAAQFARAERAAPLSSARNVNFPQRKALIEWNNRQDLIAHPWYVYIVADTGAVLGYYVAKTAPISTCNFLSSTEDLQDGGAVITAPSIDGMYYGGSGAQGGCGYFFQDYATDAIIQISAALKYYVADQPLKVDAKPITVQTK